jgi:LuxR family maltose regulon positive regulatory protein
MERKFDEIADELDHIDALPESAPVARHESSLRAVRVSLALLTGDLDGAIQLGERALDELPADDEYSRSMVTVHLGMAYRMRGDLTPAIPLLTEGMQLCDHAGNTPAWLIAASQRAIAWMTLGDLRLAHDAFREVIEIEANFGLTNLGFAIASHLGLAEVLREWNRLEEAEAVLTPALGVLERLKGGEQFGTQLYALLILIRLRCGEGDFESALEIADRALREADEADLSAWEHERASAFRARVLLALGRLDEALNWERSVAPPEQPLRSSREISYQVLARIYLASGRLDEARPLIVAARELAVGSDLRRRLIELDVLAALAAEQRAEAEAYLSHSLGLAEPDAYRRVFLDDGPELLPLMQALRRERPADAEWSTAYLDELVTEIAGDVPEPEAPRNGQAGELVERFTEREIEVLELLAEGLTNRQVADRLYLSVGTIKRHTHNIYGKLGVSSRTQAIIRGQNLRLLD